MSKLFVKIISSLLCCALLFLTACTDPNDSSMEVEAPQKIHDYCIFTADTNFANAEVGQAYSIATPEVIDRSGAKVSGFSIKAKRVLDPRGKEVSLSGGKIFLPELLGDYTVTFYCPDYDEVKEATATITCIDTRGPVIDVSNLRSFMFVSETVTVPDFEAIDRDGIDASSKQVKLIDANGQEVVPENGEYKNLQEGYYTFNFYVKDINGNASSASKSVYLTSQVQEENKLTYFSENEYQKLISKYDSKPLPNHGWNKENKTPDGEEALELSVTKENTYDLTFAVTCAITDWTSYDYFSIWVYNPTDTYLGIGLLGSNDMDRGELNPKSWNYICRKTSDFLYDAKKAVHKQNEYTQVVLSIYDVFVKDGMEAPEYLNPGDKFLFGNMRLHNQRDDVVFALGEDYAMTYYATHQKYMDLHFETSTDYVFEGDSCSSKISMTEGTIHSFNMRMSNPVQLNPDNPRYLVNIYNPNDYDIVIIDCPCDGEEIGFVRGENGSENFSTIIKAKSSGQALIQIDVELQSTYFMAVKTDGSYVDKDFTIYVGNIKASDNYTGDYGKWNAEHGDSGIWLKYKNKMKEMAQ